MRRVVFLITMGIERPSGQRYFNLAKELVRQGDQVRILALHPDLEQCQQRRFVQDGVEIWYVGQMHSRKRHGEVLPFSPLQLLAVLIRATLGMLWAILCSPAEIYHLGKPQPVNGLAAILGVLLGRGQRFWVDCDDDEVGSNRLTNQAQRMVFGFWQWLLPRLAQGVTVNTQALAARMLAARVANIVYVPNGVDLSLFQAPEPAVLAGLRTSLGLDGMQVIAYVGTIALHNHPINLLLEAFDQQLKHDPLIRLVLVGGGEDLGYVQTWIRDHGYHDRIFCLGHQDRRSIPMWMALANVTVDPVYDDMVAQARSPLKLFESLALGIPPVTGDVGDRRLVLNFAADRLIAPAGDALALAQTLQAVLATWSTTNRQACFERATDYAWSALALRWRAGYEESYANQALDSTSTK
ncbi:MAG TPA: glycosyl transferase family 1 [Herpetosiphon sp.]|uniref:Glycosyl transferase group 1 n=1 Tax=Herpetosiphon aurantiacus (strain ATCC 23779 / DSM 785 / 114-95) TaxID=316274 RepID=A9B857_HERA2|nr:glycosyltransferase [Herpetosiphon sp.]ABX05990.1 glycosyl transferase group 1 [Herpetosiphon aurantiacus DSM 785]HBW49504.1 glycosyl transferase family 1 [Herpetosiphon sp.]